MKVVREKTEILLMEYAAGTLDEASALLVASYITICPQARSYYRRCESLGGALMEFYCEPVAMADGSLRAVLSHLEDECKPAPRAEQSAFCRKQKLPAPVAGHINSCNPKNTRWRTVAPGIKFCPLTLTENDNHSVMLVRLGPGVRGLRHRHNGTELTLVLEGGYSDEFGTYRAGDFIIADAETAHAPVADKNAGCTCLIVTTAPIRFTGHIAGLLNYFMR